MTRMSRRRLATSITVSETSGSCSQSRTRRLLRVVRMPKPCSMRHRSGIGTKPTRCCGREATLRVAPCRGHRQVKPQGNGEAPKLARAANLCGSLGASDLGPHRERLRADGSVLGGGEVIAMEAEEVVDLIVGGEEPLHLAG